MSNKDHIVELPKAVWVIKIIQLIIAILILAFSAYILSYNPLNSYSAFAIFTAIFSGAALVYYFVALHGNHQLYNWVALLVLESLACLFWLVVWALYAAALTVVYGYYYYRKRDLSRRYTSYAEADAEENTAGALWYTTLAFALINFILYCLTLGFMAMGIHKHRTAGRPMVYGGRSSWNSGSRAEKNEMEPMRAAPAYSHYAPEGQNPVQAPYQQQPQYAQQGRPVPPNTHEIYGGGRY